MSLFEDISISVVILSAIFYVSKNYYTFYRNYIKYLYLLIYTFLIFSLGWNLSLINSETDNLVITEWKYLMIVFISFIIILVISFLGKLNHHGNHLVEHEW